MTFLLSSHTKLSEYICSRLVNTTTDKAHDLQVLWFLASFLLVAQKRQERSTSEPQMQLSAITEQPVCLALTPVYTEVLTLVFTSLYICGQRQLYLGFANHSTALAKRGPTQEKHLIS